MKERRPNTPFGHLIEKAMDEAELDKRRVAEAAELHFTTLYRMISGKGPSKGNVYAIIGSINRLAGREVVQLDQALKAAGYDGRAGVDPLAGRDLVLEQIIDRVVDLDEETKRDALALVDALHKRRKA